MNDGIDATSTSLAGLSDSEKYVPQFYRSTELEWKHLKPSVHLENCPYSGYSI